MINTMVLPYLVDKTISLSIRSPKLEHLKIETRLIDEKFASVTQHAVSLYIGIIDYRSVPVPIVPMTYPPL